MRQLGGETIILTGNEMQLGRGETIADTARVLSRYVDAIMIRTLEHQTAARACAENATVPVINGLTDAHHPCQVMADIMTFEEHRGPITGNTVAWIGDANNVLRSLGRRPRRAFGFRLHIASPPELRAADQSMLADGRGSAAPRSTFTDGSPARRSRVPTASSPTPGCRWATTDARAPPQLLLPYQVDSASDGARPSPDALFMHCLPAHRGEEVTDEVIDGPQSVVFDEAENRLHAQKAILAWCFGIGTADWQMTRSAHRSTAVEPVSPVPATMPSSLRPVERRSTCAAAPSSSARRSTRS